MSDLDLGVTVRVERAGRWVTGTVVGLHGPWPRLIGVDVLLVDGTTVNVRPREVQP